MAPVEGGLLDPSPGIVEEQGPHSHAVGQDVAIWEGYFTLLLRSQALIRPAAA